MREPYRNRERHEAIRQYALRPSPDTQATLDREEDLLARHLGARSLAVFALLLIFDTVLIFCFWNSGLQKERGKKKAIT